MDSINQIAKILNTIKNTSDFAAKRKQRRKRIERATDTFDTLVPFRMDFRASEKNNTYISLFFKPPAPSACCGTCYCSVCEQFSNNVTITLTYGYISGTLNVFVGSNIHNAVQVTDFTELDPGAGTLQLGTTGEFIRVCYIYFAGGCNPLGTGGGSECTPFIDDFNRSVGSGWGPDYTINTPPSTSASVNGTEAVMTVVDSTGVVAGTSLPTVTPWTLESKVRLSNIPLFFDGGTDVLKFQFKNASTYIFEFIWYIQDTNVDNGGDSYLQLFSHPSGPSDFDFSFDASNVSFIIKMQHDGSGTYRAKVWNASGAEPGSWNLTNTGAGTVDNFEVNFGQGFTNGDTRSIHIDYIYVTCD